MITTRSNAIDDTGNNIIALNKGRPLAPFVTKGTRPKIIKRVIVALCSLILALISAEIFVRVAPQSSVGFVLDATMSRYEPSLFQRHPTQINILAPDASVVVETIEYTTSIRTNSIGLRGDEVSPNGDSITIITVGDSFTLGLQVSEEQTWQALLSTSLTESLNQSVEVLNAGVDGYGTLQATQQLKRLAEQTGADIAILSFYLGNDFRDNAILDERRRLMNARENPPSQDESASRGNAALAKTSSLYATWLAASQVRDNANDFRIVEYADEMTPFVSEEALSRLMPKTLSALSEFESACTELNITCAISMIPPSWLVNSERTDSTLALFGLQGDITQLSAPAQAVRSSTILPVVDLTEQLSLTSGNYLTFDPHWGANGHQVAADTLHPRILELINNPSGYSP